MSRLLHKHLLDYDPYAVLSTTVQLGRVQSSFSPCLPGSKRDDTSLTVTARASVHALCRLPSFSRKVETNSTVQTRGNSPFSASQIGQRIGRPPLFFTGQKSPSMRSYAHRCLRMNTARLRSNNPMLSAIRRGGVWYHSRISPRPRESEELQ